MKPNKTIYGSMPHVKIAVILDLSEKKHSKLSIIFRFSRIKYLRIYCFLTNFAWAMKDVLTNLLRHSFLSSDSL